LRIGRRRRIWRGGCFRLRRFQMYRRGNRSHKLEFKFKLKCMGGGRNPIRSQAVSPASPATPPPTSGFPSTAREKGGISPISVRMIQWSDVSVDGLAARSCHHRLCEAECFGTLADSCRLSVCRQRNLVGKTPQQTPNLAIPQTGPTSGFDGWA